MKPSELPFTAIYTQWLESFRAMMPGWQAAGPAEALSSKKEQIAANQEWEDEGGSIKPAPVAHAKVPPKLPL